jgi:hypothetical protein
MCVHASAVSCGALDLDLWLYRCSASGSAGYLPSLKGDALEIVATFTIDGNATATEFGVTLRGNGSDTELGGCRVSYDPVKKQIGGSTSPDITAQVRGGDRWCSAASTLEPPLTTDHWLHSTMQHIDFFH